MVAPMSFVFHNDQSMSDTEDKTISIGPHWTYGWLRRPELDEPIGYAYEDPDGDIVFIPAPHAKKWVRLRCCIDASSGEKYLCLYERIK
jgi:hypothetical protein